MQSLTYSKPVNCGVLCCACFAVGAVWRASLAKVRLANNPTVSLLLVLLYCLGTRAVRDYTFFGRHCICLI